MAAQMRPTHPAGVIEMRMGSFQSLAAEPLQGAPPSAADPPPIGVDRSAVECKSLRFDHTPSEVGERLAEYATGTVNGKRSHLQRHLDRTSYLRTNRSQLAHFTGIPVDRLQLRSALVTERLAPMQFFGRVRERLDVVTDYESLDVEIRNR